MKKGLKGIIVSLLMIVFSVCFVKADVFATCVYGGFAKSDIKEKIKEKTGKSYTQKYINLEDFINRQFML